MPTVDAPATTPVAQPFVPRGESWASSPAARNTMVANRGRDTGPELAVRRAIHRLGLRYRVGVRPVQNLRRTADIVFSRRRIAVFIDGCFWHRCPVHYVEPKTNACFWAAKVQANVSRDRETDRHLIEAGWTVLRFWEHEDPTAVAQAVNAVVNSSK